MAQKETKMVIKVDLACEKCRKKIKKVLCDIPQIQNQEYDEKENTVTITVVCGNPDEIKKKICCKGGKTVKSIEIVKPKPPPPPPKSDKLVVEVVFKLPEDCPKGCCSPPWCLPPPPTKCPPPPPPKCPPPPPPPCPPPPCCKGVGAGPCCSGFGRPAGPCCYGRPVYDSWGAGCDRRYYLRR